MAKAYQYRDQVADIFNNFDFARVREVMVQTNWTYWYTHPRVPSVEELKMVAREHLAYVASDRGGPGSASASGGFRAENRNGFVSLSFEIAEYDTAVYA